VTLGPTAERPCQQDLGSPRVTNTATRSSRRSSCRPFKNMGAKKVYEVASKTRVVGDAHHHSIVTGRATTWTLQARSLRVHARTEQGHRQAAEVACEFIKSASVPSKGTTTSPRSPRSAPTTTPPSARSSPRPWTRSARRA
jgi:hypothetical protein